MNTFKVPKGTKEIKVIEHNEEGRITIEFIPELPTFEIGDIVASNLYITIYEGTNATGGILNGLYLDYEDNKLILRDVDCGCGFTKNYHLATEEEKALLLSALDREGYVWNAEAKKVEKKRWRAEFDNRYYFIDLKSNDIDSTADRAWQQDDIRYLIGNYFQTNKQAKEAFEKVKELLLTLHS